MQSIRKTLDKHDLHVETSCQVPLLSKKNTKGPFEYAKIHLDRHVDFWKNVLSSDVTKLEHFIHPNLLKAWFMDRS